MKLALSCTLAAAASAFSSSPASTRLGPHTPRRGKTAPKGSVWKSSSPSSSLFAEAPRDVFGIGSEEVMLGAARAGQSSFAVDVKDFDPFGYEDEARTAAANAARRTKAAKADPFGFSSEGGPALGVRYEDPNLAGPASSSSSGSSSSWAAPRRMSEAVPFLERPAVLDEISLAGDYGFDPLNLAADAGSLVSLREAELKHARLAMLAAVGWPVSELAHSALAKAAHLPSVVANLGGDAPSTLNGGLGAVPPAFWVGAVALATIAELQGLQNRNAGKAPGDLGLRGGSRLAAFLLKGPRNVEEAELANGRLAMLAVVGFAAQEFAAKLSGIPVPVVDQTPTLFHFPFWYLFH